MRRRELVLAACAFVVGGAVVAVVMELSGGQAAPLVAPVSPVAAPKPVTAAPDPAALPPAVPSSSVPPGVSSAAAPRVHVATAPAVKTHASTRDEAPSDRIRDRVYQQPLNPRPQGQVTGPGIIPQNGTKTGNTGPSDEPVTTPTALPNPAENPPPYTPPVQPSS
ncbi:hypothetical protein AB0K15_29960 [Amycolatopsis sp. NPDC049253]|uniref:hypothetical protein n=1 Tax=Amycolatopsis sp. NPDC049253 TaxID=3155274 RepID=UPI00344A34F3